MDAERRKRLERERNRLIIAASGMSQVAGAAAHLEAHMHLSRMSDDAYRVMWTGLVITYARPYLASNKLGPIRGRLGTPTDPALLTLHKNLCARRDDLFAHNDETEHRTVTDVYAALGIGAGKFTEAYSPMEPSALPVIAELANHQRGRFRSRVDEIEEQLGRVTLDQSA
jgi:hypothetical protein